MASSKDHLRRDAEHRVRIEVAGLLGQYQRRILEEAYADITHQINEAKPGTDLSGRDIGIKAFQTATSSFLSVGNGAPQRAIDAGSDTDTD